MPHRRIVVDYSMKAEDLFAEVMSKYLTEEFLLEVAIHCDDNQHRSSVDPVDLAAVAAIAKPLLGISRGRELAARVRAVRAKYQVHELFHTLDLDFDMLNGPGRTGSIGGPIDRLFDLHAKLVWDGIWDGIIQSAVTP
jgi:hypothetical protein